MATQDTVPASAGRAPVADVVTDAAATGGPAGSSGHTTAAGSAPPRRGIVRAHAPTMIPLSPIKMGSPLPLHTQPGTEPEAKRASVAPSASPMVSANALPDNPEQASNVANLFAHPLAPAWSPSAQPPAGSPSGVSDSGMHGEGSSYFRSPSGMPPRGRVRTPGGGTRPASWLFSPTLGALPSGAVAPAPHLTPNGAVSNETNIFERDIERFTQHPRSPQQAVEMAVPAVLEDAADAIVDEHAQTLEIVTPSNPSSPGRPSSASPRSPSSGTQSPVSRTSRARRPSQPSHLRVSSADASLSDVASGSFLSPPSQQQQGRSRGHQRPGSDASFTFTSASPRQRTSSASGWQMPAATTPTAPSSVSIDGAVIPESEAATMGHSLDGLAGAITGLSTSSRTGSPVSQPPVHSPHRTPASVAASGGSYFTLTHPDDSGTPAAAGAPAQPTRSPRSPGSPNLFRYSVMPENRHGPTSPNSSQMRRSPSAQGAPVSTLSPVMSRGGLLLRQPQAHPTMHGTAGADDPRLQPQARSAGSPGMGDTRRVSFLAYSDLLNDAEERKVVVENAHTPLA